MIGFLLYHIIFSFKSIDEKNPNVFIYLMKKVNRKEKIKNFIEKSNLSIFSEKLNIFSDEIF